MRATEGFEAALDTLLREVSKAVVVDNARRRRSKRSRRLRERGAGRGAFITLDYEADRRRRRGAATRSTRSSAKVRSPMPCARAMPEAYIVGTLGEALDRAKERPSATFVTLEGDIVRGPLVIGGKIGERDARRLLAQAPALRSRSAPRHRGDARQRHRRGVADDRRGASRRGRRAHPRRGARARRRSRSCANGAAIASAPITELDRFETRPRRRVGRADAVRRGEGAAHRAEERGDRRSAAARSAGAASCRSRSAQHEEQLAESRARRSKQVTEVGVEGARRRRERRPAT